MTITVLLVDDHTMVRNGLRAVLETDPALKIVGEAENGRDCLELVARLCPDVVVMDIAMPDLNGVEATRKIIAADDQVKVVALSAYAEGSFVKAMIEAGASGYVLKTGAADELLTAIHAVTRGKKYLSPAVAEVVVDGFMAGQALHKFTAVTDLGPREREVLQLLAEGNKSREIADQLAISEHTVEVHRRNIMTKLNLHSVAELTKYAVRQGITSL